MSLTGKLVQKVDVTCPGNLLHETFKYKLNEFSVIVPDKVISCDLVTGQWGAPGSVLSWQFIHDGKVDTAKEVIEAVDDEAHKVVFKVIEGEILQAYSSFTSTVHMEGIAGDKQSVIWTIDFEKVNASINDPTSYMDWICTLTNDLDAYILKLA